MRLLIIGLAIQLEFEANEKLQEVFRKLLEQRALLTEELKRDTEFLKRIAATGCSLLIRIYNMQRGDRDYVWKNTLQVFSLDIPMRRHNTQLKGNSPEAITIHQAMRLSDLECLEKKTIRLLEQDTGDRQPFIFYQDEDGIRATDELNEATEAICYLGVIDSL